MTRNETDSNVKQIEKVLPEKHTNMLLIVDDLPQVWDKYANQTVNVLPFHFWRNSSEISVGQAVLANGEKEGTKVTEKEAEKVEGKAPIKRKEQLEPLVTWKNENDCYLYFLGPVLTTIHQIFYKFETISTKQVV